MTWHRQRGDQLTIYLVNGIIDTRPSVVNLFDVGRKHIFTTDEIIWMKSSLRLRWRPKISRSHSPKSLEIVDLGGVKNRGNGKHTEVDRITPIISEDIRCFDIERTWKQP